MCYHRSLFVSKMSFRRFEHLYPLIRNIIVDTNYSTSAKTKAIPKEVEDFRFTKHVYKHLYPWKSLKEFANSLIESIVYNEGAIIALNKPYGVAQRVMNDYVTDPRQVVGTLNASSAGDAPYTLAEAIPVMKEILNINELEVVKSTERYSSGITLLASSQVSKKAISKGLSATKSKQAPYSYWAVGIGPFAKDAAEETVGISLLMLDEKIKEQQPVIEENFSKRRQEKGIVKAVSVQYRTLSKSSEMPSVLYEIFTTKTKWHFLRVYSAHKGVAVLGDNFYGSRVKWIFGKPVTISLFNNATRELPILPVPILRSLEISQKMAAHIPTHLHLYRVILTLGKKQVIITAPPPSHFAYSCNKLGLVIPTTTFNTSQLPDS